MSKLEIWPVAALLFVVSLACVSETLWNHAKFDTTATLALLFVVGWPWFMLRSWRARRRDESASVARDVHHQPPRVRP